MRQFLGLTSALALGMLAAAALGQTPQTVPYPAYPPPAMSASPVQNGPTTPAISPSGTIQPGAPGCVGGSPLAGPACSAPVCQGNCDMACGSCADSGQPWRLFPQRNALGLLVGGWIDQGITTNSVNPTNPPAGQGNLPTAFNYRDDQYQLNQLYLYLHRPTDTRCREWDLGGRIDFLYGEDYIFTQAAGWETRPDFTNRWNASAGGDGIDGTGRLGLAIPQIYGEVAYNNLTFKVGHFYTLIGYEVVPAPQNFFYSHSYMHMYGEPFTHTGGLATWSNGDGLLVTGGIVNGWDKFDAESDKPAFLNAFTWSSLDRCTTFTLAGIVGEEDGADLPLEGTRTMLSAVISHVLGERWTLVTQGDWGQQENGTVVAGTRRTREAEWYGVSQYVYYKITDRVSAGCRYEWFNDQAGTRVVGAPYAGHYENLTLGLNWKPIRNVVVRPEGRWDWFDAHDRGPLQGPYGDRQHDDQLTAAVDAIVLF